MFEIYLPFPENNLNFHRLNIFAFLSGKNFTFFRKGGGENCFDGNFTFQFPRLEHICQLTTYKRMRQISGNIDECRGWTTADTSDVNYIV